MYTLGQIVAIYEQFISYHKPVQILFTMKLGLHEYQRRIQNNNDKRFNNSTAINNENM